MALTFRLDSPGVYVAGTRSSRMGGVPLQPLSWRTSSLPRSAPRLRRPCRFRAVFSSRLSPGVLRRLVLRLLWLLPATLDPSPPRFRVGLGLTVPQLHLPRLDGCSPGKFVDFHCPPTFLYVHQLRGDFRTSVFPGTSSSHGRLLEGSISLLRWQFWLRLPSDPSLAHRDRLPLLG